MNGSIRFRYPVMPGGDLTALAAQIPTFIGQNTRVDGNPAVITGAVLQFDPLSGHSIEFEVELASMPPELTEKAERYLSISPVVSWEPPRPPRRPQGTFATAAEALAYAESLPPRYHVLDDHGETVPCDHPACDHCRGRSR